MKEKLFRLRRKLIARYRKLRGTYDRYDEAIDFLIANPELIHCSWNIPNANVGGLLFQRVCDINVDVNGVCGCLTQIRDGRKAATVELTVMIQDDERIPYNSDGITIYDLELFAYYQRLVDAKLGRSPEIVHY